MFNNELNHHMKQEKNTGKRKLWKCVGESEANPLFQTVVGWIFQQEKVHIRGSTWYWLPLNTNDGVACSRDKYGLRLRLRSKCSET